MSMSSSGAAMSAASRPPSGLVTLLAEWGDADGLARRADAGRLPHADPYRGSDLGCTRP
jgi:hypothetical protein